MATFKQGSRAKNQGGARVGAGRKPKLLTVIKRKIAENGADETEFAFGLLCAVMRDDAAPRRDRVAAAIEVMNRTLGKPATTLTLTARPIQIVGFDLNNALATIAPRPMENHDVGSQTVSGGDGAAVGENVDGG